MSGLEYYRRVLRSALRNTFSHARKKIVVGMILSILAYLFQYLLDLRNWSDTGKIIISLLAAAAMVILGSFIWNLLREPVLLHRNQQSEIDDLSKRLSDTSTELAQAKAAPPVTPHEQEQRRLVSKKMADFTPEDVKVIEALLHHGEIHRRAVGSLGFPVDVFYKAADKGRQTGLVKERAERHSGGTEQYLSINPAFESALKHYLETITKPHGINCTSEYEQRG